MVWACAPQIDPRDTGRGAGRCLVDKEFLRDKPSPQGNQFFVLQKAFRARQNNFRLLMTSASISHRTSRARCPDDAIAAIRNWAMFVLSVPCLTYP